MARSSIARIAALILAGAALLSPLAQAAAPDAAHREAARLLAQATFGPTLEEIDSVIALGDEAWVDRQLRQMPTLHYPLWVQRDIENDSHGEMQGVWLETAVHAPDQLRQRVAFALSEILVVSANSDIPAAALVNYYDILVGNAFGNFRNLLGSVTRSMAMGRYLSMYQNRRPDPERGIRADENFAREVMQLFTIGLVRLNPDGTPKLNSLGKTTPTYTQKDIENLARIFTGWSSSGTPDFYYWPPNWTAPMAAWEDFHDRDAKRFKGVDFPAGRTAQAELTQALDILFAHPNVGPFIAQHLIKRLVTSNPTPAYVQRVATVFNNNGSRVRGDLRAVVRAILLDPEARQGHIDMPERFGKVREPLLRLTHVLRAFDATSTAPDGVFPPQWIEWELGQAPMFSPSVFNFFPPAYAPDGELRTLGLVAPEMKLADDSLINRSANYLSGLLWQFGANPWIATNPDNIRVLLDFDREAALAGNPDALLDHLDLLLMSGQMPDDLQVSIRRRLGDWRMGDDEFAAYWRTRSAIFLMMSSPQYLVQK